MAGSYLAQLNATNGNLDGWIFLWTTLIRLRPAQVLQICRVRSWSCKWGCLCTQSKEGNYKHLQEASGLTGNPHPDLYTCLGIQQLLPSSVSDQKPEVQICEMATFSRFGEVMTYITALCFWQWKIEKHTAFIWRKAPRVFWWRTTSWSGGKRITSGTHRIRAVASLERGPPEADLLKQSSLGRRVSWPIRVDGFKSRGQRDQARASDPVRTGDLDI